MKKTIILISLIFIGQSALFGMQADQQGLFLLTPNGWVPAHIETHHVVRQVLIPTQILLPAMEIQQVHTVVPSYAMQHHYPQQSIAPALSANPFEALMRGGSDEDQDALGNAFSCYFQQFPDAAMLITQPYEIGYSPLDKAIQMGYYKLVKYFLDIVADTADLTAPNHRGNTILVELFIKLRWVCSHPEHPEFLENKAILLSCTNNIISLTDPASFDCIAHQHGYTARSYYNKFLAAHFAGTDLDVAMNPPSSRIKSAQKPSPNALAEEFKETDEFKEMSLISKEDNRTDEVDKKSNLLLAKEIHTSSASPFSSSVTTDRDELSDSPLLESPATDRASSITLSTSTPSAQLLHIEESKPLGLPPETPIDQLQIAIQSNDPARLQATLKKLKKQIAGCKSQAGNLLSCLLDNDAVDCIPLLEKSLPDIFSTKNINTVCFVRFCLKYQSHSIIKERFQNWYLMLDFKKLTDGKGLEALVKRSVLLPQSAPPAATEIANDTSFSKKVLKQKTQSELAEMMQREELAQDAFECFLANPGNPKLIKVLELKPNLLAELADKINLDRPLELLLEEIGAHDLLAHVRKINSHKKSF